MKQEMNELARLGAIAQNFASQDNRLTAWPMFAVQQRVREYGFNSDYAEDYLWIDRDESSSSGETVEASKEQLEAIEANDDYRWDDEVEIADPGWEEGDPGEQRVTFSKLYYRERWEFVTACFTEQGCKDYIARKGHDLAEPRIYAYSGYHNAEWRRISRALKALGESPVVTGGMK